MKNYNVVLTENLIDEAKFTLSSLEKAFENETEAIEDAAEKQKIEDSN